MEILILNEIDSTNNFVKEHVGDLAPMTMVAAVNQSAGRGQRGNCWESEAGKNLIFSFHFVPEDIGAASQFVISEAVALSVVSTLNEFGISAEVKWPNDIYVGDKKICGILIENSILGTSISHCVVGVGLNVNQTRFLSDAPNPVSMRMISGREHAVSDVALKMGENLEYFIGQIGSEKGRRSVHALYIETLWRGDGSYYDFHDNLTGENFRGAIEEIEPTGHLLLLREGTSPKRFAFKEVTFL